MLRSNPLQRPLFLVFLLLACASSIGADFEAVKVALRAGDYRTAAEKLAPLLDEQPSWAEGWISLGQSQYMLGLPEAAGASILRALKADPATNVYHAYMSAGQLLYGQKRYADALPPLSLALEHAGETDHQTTSFMLGSCHFLAGQYAEARRVFERSLEQHGFETEAAYHLALACQRTSDYPCALATLRRLAGDGVSAARRARVSRYLAQWSFYWALARENSESRETLLAQAILDSRSWYLADPANSTALELYGETLLAAGEASRLSVEFAPLAERDPEHCHLRTMLARAYNALGRAAEAGRQAETAVRCDDRSGNAHLELARACVGQLLGEHSSLADVRADAVRAREALASLEEALRLGTSRETQARALLQPVRATLARLAESESERLVAERDHEDAVTEELRREREELCRGILWKMSVDPDGMTDEERSFDKQHDCRQYASAR